MKSRKKLTMLCFYKLEMGNAQKPSPKESICGPVYKTISLLSPGFNGILILFLVLISENEKGNIS